MSKISRRAVLSTTGRAAVATLALGGLSVAATGEDAELRRLWAEYKQQEAVFLAAREAHSELRRRIAAEHGVDEDARVYSPQWSDTLNILYETDTPLNRLSEEWNDADVVLRETVKVIQATPAEGLYGIGVKLAAIHGNDDGGDGWDFRISIRSAHDSINALIGTDFAITLMDDEAEGDADA